MKTTNKLFIIYIVLYIVLCIISALFIRFDMNVYGDNSVIDIEWNIPIALYYFIALPIAAYIPIYIYQRIKKNVQDN